MGERSQRSLALDWLERASAQLVQAIYEMQNVGPSSERHWQSAKKRLVTTRERLDLAESFIDLALEPFSADLVAERERIVSRRR